jgi:hypothetical protein
VHPGVEAFGYAKRIIPFSKVISTILTSLPVSSWSVRSGNLSPTTRPFFAFLTDSGSDAVGFSAARFGAGVGAEGFAGFGASFADVVDG